MADPKRLPPAPLVPLEDLIWKQDSRAYPRGNSYTARFVPYINASIVAGLLDDWVGPDGWQDVYEDVQMGGRTVTVCRLSVWSPLHADWITKTDVGVSPGGVDDMAVKGLVSDAFKRAGILKWGVGRNVYSLPSLYAPVTVNARGSQPTEDELKKARPASNYLEVLTRQLKDLGFEVTNVRGEHDEPDEPATEPAPAEPAPKPIPPAPVTHPDDRENANIELERKIIQLKKDLIELVGDPKTAAKLWKQAEPPGGPQSEGSANATYQSALRAFRNNQAEPADDPTAPFDTGEQDTLV